MNSTTHIPTAQALREQRKAGVELDTIPGDAYCDCCGLRLARVRASTDCVLCSGCAADGLGIPSTNTATRPR